MRSFLWLWLVLCLCWPKPTWSQFREEPDAEAAEVFLPDSWFIELNYTNVFDQDFTSDAITGDAGWYVLVDQDASWPELWGDATFDLGPIIGLRMNSGILDNQAYAEQIMLWTAGLTARVNYQFSQLVFNGQFGQLTGFYTLKSGYEKKRQDWVLSAELIYESSAGRNQEEWFVPAWQMKIIGSTPTAPQVVLDWGYNQLTHNLNQGAATNTYSVHVVATIDAFDIAVSDNIILPLTIKGSGGKYNVDIKYFGLGGGVGLLINKKPALGLYIDRLWGWDNSKFDNWALNFKFNLSFFEQFWWNE